MTNHYGCGKIPAARCGDLCLALPEERDKSPEDDPDDPRRRRVAPAAGAAESSLACCCSAATLLIGLGMTVTLGVEAEGRVGTGSAFSAVGGLLSRAISSSREESMISVGVKGGSGARGVSLPGMKVCARLRRERDSRHRRRLLPLLLLLLLLPPQRGAINQCS